jgi:hypothetical protein
MKNRLELGFWVHRAVCYYTNPSIFCVVEHRVFTNMQLRAPYRPKLGKGPASDETESTAKAL